MTTPHQGKPNITAPGTAEPVSLAGTGQLLGTSKLQDAIDQFGKSVDKLEGLVNKAGGVGGGQGVFSARPTGDSKTAGASGPTFGGTHGTPASSAGKAPGLAGTVAGSLGSIFGGKGPAPGGSGVFAPTQPGSGAPSAGNANAGGPKFTTISGAKGQIGRASCRERV